MKTIANSRQVFFSFFILLFATASYAQTDSNSTQSMSKDKPSQVYRLKAAVDIPVVAVGVGWSLYAFPKIYDKPNSSVQAIMALNKNDVNGFDRWAAGKYSNQADANSDILFYAAIPAPLFLLFDKKISRDAGKVGFLYLEAMAVTGLFYTGPPYFVDRYRPYIYNTSVPMEERVSGIGRNSFLGGHPALVATSTFFMAKIYGDYHPDSKFKWVFYGGAIAATGTTAYLRLKAGRHFPTDLLAGTTLGVLSGILVPQFHKNKAYNKHLTILPFTGNAHGLTAIYRL